MHKIKINNQTDEVLERWHYEGDYMEIMHDIKINFLDEHKTVTIFQRRIYGGDGIMYMVWIEED